MIMDSAEMILKPFSASFILGSAVLLMYLIVEGRRKLMYYRIPSIGCGNDPLTSFRAAMRFRTDCKELIQEGYDKFKGRMFKLAMADRWVIIVTGKELVNELWSAPDGKLNFHKAVEETTKSRFSFGEAVTENTYHVGVVRTRLTRNIPDLFPELLDELACSFSDEFKPSIEWKAYSPIPHVQQIVCRASNRLFVGLPKCRDPSYVRLNIGYTLEVMYARKTLNSYPSFLQSVIGRYITNIAARTKEAVEHLTPIIQERLSILERSNADYSQLPNDLLTWLIIDTDKKGRNILELCQRVLVVNFGAIHTTTNTFVHLLFYLAANPDWVEILREDVKSATEVHGWTKTAFNKMPKLDSILHECLRIDGVNLWSLIRVAMEDYTFSNGVTVPKGALLAAPTFALHTDGSTVPTTGSQSVDVFDPWRYCDGKAEESSNQSTTTGWSYLPFGHGKMSCPGRFFAGAELKLMVAYFIENYDVKLEYPGPKPPNVYIGHSCAPNQSARVMVKARNM
ncbi:cytochrome P450 [Marasmius fiardii PR-910]|nr:cytochrome P450 [Marasmius fiardii PR-910]